MSAGAPLLVAVLALVAPPAQADQQLRLKDRFLAAAEGWRKEVTALDVAPGKATSAAAATDAPLPRDLRELRLLVAPTPVPAWKAQRRLDGSTVIVSAGWLELLDELLRAEALSPPDAACFNGYAALLAERLGSAREAGVERVATEASAAGPASGVAPAAAVTSAARPPPRRLLAWPRLRTLLGTPHTPDGCADFRPADLRRPALQTRVDAGSDAVILWLLTRQAARVGALPDPAASVASTALAASPASGPAARATAATPTTAATFAAAASSPAVACSAIGPEPAVGARTLPAQADARAWCALYRKGLGAPRTLRWMQANAILFEPASAPPPLGP